ncbi:MAG TPA: hypothetical protein VG815_13230 [Chloroflexota bacterium]|jgi:hypothetical protein|nr:hypothetical protein [Chloroflexota bacterium]
MRLTIDDIYTRLAARLPDDQLAHEVELARRAVELSARTRKTIAQHKLYCLQCELKRRAEQRDQRNPGLA